MAQQDSPGLPPPYVLTVRAAIGYFMSASGVSAPPYGRQEPSEVVGEQLQLRGAVPMPAARDHGHRPTFPQQPTPGGPHYQPRHRSSCQCHRTCWISFREFRFTCVSYFYSLNPTLDSQQLSGGELGRCVGAREFPCRPDSVDRAGFSTGLSVSSRSGFTGSSRRQPGTRSTCIWH